VIENYWANAAYSLIPTILLGLIFWLVMRSIFRADRTARLATENAATWNAATEKAAAVGSTAAAAREPSA
jgi:hypothetical protein